jgi:pimeloyl-ACP methyl ester carboxylesterase
MVWGDHDKRLPPAFGRRLAARVGGSRRHLLKMAGLSPHQERPKTFNARLVDALRAT